MHNFDALESAVTSTPPTVTEPDVAAGKSMRNRGGLPHTAARGNQNLATKTVEAHVVDGQELAEPAHDDNSPWRCSASSLTMSLRAFTRQRVSTSFTAPAPAAAAPRPAARSRSPGCNRARPAGAPPARRARGSVRHPHAVPLSHHALRLRERRDFVVGGGDGRPAGVQLQRSLRTWKVTWQIRSPRSARWSARAFESASPCSAPRRPLSHRDHETSMDTSHDVFQSPLLGKMCIRPRVVVAPARQRLRPADGPMLETPARDPRPTRHDPRAPSVRRVPSRRRQ